MTEEIHDLSRLDAFMRNRRRVAFLSAVWKPMLAGAVGAALVIGCVWVVLPKFSTREIVVPAITMRETEVPKVTMRDVSVDHVVPTDVSVPNIVPHDTPVPNIVLVPHDVPVDHFVPHDTPFNNYVPVPHDVPVDRLEVREKVIEIPSVVAAPAPEPPGLTRAGAPIELRAEPPPGVPLVTAPEQQFASTPEFQSAQFKGRLVSDPDGLIRFDDGSVFVPAIRDQASRRQVRDFSSRYLTKKYWGDLAFCNAIPTDEGLFECLVIHDGVVINLETTRRAKSPTRAEGALR